MWGSLLHHQNQEAPLEGEKLDPPPLFMAGRASISSGAQNG